MAREEEGHLNSPWGYLCLHGLGVVGGTEGWMSRQEGPGFRAAILGGWGGEG